MSFTPKPPWYLLLEGIPSLTPGTGLYNSLDQQRPELILRMLANILGSRPNLGEKNDNIIYLIQIAYEIMCETYYDGLWDSVDLLSLTGLDFTFTNIFFKDECSPIHFATYKV